MLYSFVSKSNLMVGVFVSALSIFAATSGQAQSASTSDSDYLSALTTMASDMDLNGLAAQTYAPISVATPQLSEMVNVVSCETLQAQAAESGHPIEIFGADTTLSSEELSNLAKCELSGTGVVVSYLMPSS